MSCSNIFDCLRFLLALFVVMQTQQQLAAPADLGPQFDSAPSSSSASWLSANKTIANPASGHSDIRVRHNSSAAVQNNQADNLAHLPKQIKPSSLTKARPTSRLLADDFPQNDQPASSRSEEHEYSSSQNSRHFFGEEEEETEANRNSNHESPFSSPDVTSARHHLPHNYYYRQNSLLSQKPPPNSLQLPEPEQLRMTAATAATLDYWLSIERKWSQNSNCPCRCELDAQHRRLVRCDAEHAPGLNQLPNDLDSAAQVFVFSGTAEQPKQATLGRVFQHLAKLEEIQITYANIPSIGEATFWPGTSLQHLNLSQNRIQLLNPKNFLNLSSLHTLDLSHNRLRSLPSGVFFYLTQLQSLHLQHNQLKQLSPRVFLNLQQLARLNLGSNPLSRLEPVDIRGLQTLQELRLAGCRLRELPPALWLELPSLRLLDLSGNQLSSLQTDQFRHLKQLRSLLLRSNQLRQLSRFAFSGHRLDRLDLGENQLSGFANCTFCDCQAQQLQLDRNQLQQLTADDFRPLQLRQLQLAHNPKLGSQQLFQALHQLVSLTSLDLSETGLDDRFTASSALKQSAAGLQFLNLSRNSLVNISLQFLPQFGRLQSLDLSFNRMYRMAEPLAKQLARLSAAEANASLTSLLWLHGNPYRCFTCHILPLRDLLLRLKPRAYFAHCTPSSPQFCARCQAPADLLAQPIHLLDESRIHFCTDPSIFQRLYTSEPRVGLIIALIIICSILIIIVLIVFKYRQKSAVYYTQESKLNDKTLFTIQQVAKATAFSPTITSPSGSSPTHSHAMLAEHPHGQLLPTDAISHQLSHSNEQHGQPASTQHLRTLSTASAAVYERPTGLGLERPTGLGLERPSGLGLERPTRISLDTELPISEYARTGRQDELPMTLPGHFASLAGGRPSLGTATVFTSSAPAPTRTASTQLSQNGADDELGLGSARTSQSSSSGCGVVALGAAGGPSGGLSGKLAPSSFVQPPISEYLICTNVTSICSQPIYSQPNMLCSSSVYDAHFQHQHQQQQQAGILLNPAMFGSQPTPPNSDGVYYSQPGSIAEPATLLFRPQQPVGGSAQQILISRSSSMLDETRPKCYRI